MILLTSCTPLVIHVTIGSAQAQSPTATAQAAAAAPAAAGAANNLAPAKSVLPVATAAPQAARAVPTADSGSSTADAQNSEPSSGAVSSSAGPGCAASSPDSGGYTVTVCITAPSGGAALSGVTMVTAKVSVTGSNQGVRRVVFYLNGAYLLTDYQSAYSFSLPTNRWADGSYKLEANALMRDGFATTKAALDVTFNNGVSAAAQNTGRFTPATGTAPDPGAPFVVMAAGDGASGENNAGKVVTLIEHNSPNLFLYLGDVYEKGTPTEFYNYYGVNGAYLERFRTITDPTVGNHEYTSSSNAAGYFDYWNNIPSYYSFNAGGWHFISLNANSSKIGVGPDSAQYKWLQQDLSANTGACTIAFYHQPLFNIGPEGPAPSMSDIWALLAKYNVSIVLNGHDHDYQRWTPLDGGGSPNANGITEFVVGSGGHGLQTPTKTDPRVAFADSKNPEAFGALKLSLSSTAAQFSYLSINGSTLDSRAISCKK